MTLTAGRGPLGVDPAGWFVPPLHNGIDHDTNNGTNNGTVYVEPHPRRIVAVLNGSTVIHTEHALMVHRRGHALSYAFPADEVSGLPTHAVAEAPGYVHVPWNAVDSWFEEGRELVHYPPNPYHRIDCRHTDRVLKASVSGTVLVDTTDTVIVFETALAPRLYVDPVRVLTGLIRRSESSTYCNYKGYATYWSAVIGDTVHEDVAWSYEDTPPEARPIQGFLSFDETRADLITELPQSPRAAAERG